MPGRRIGRVLKTMLLRSYSRNQLGGFTNWILRLGPSALLRAAVGVIDDGVDTSGGFGSPTERTTRSGFGTHLSLLLTGGTLIAGIRFIVRGAF